MLNFIYMLLMLLFPTSCPAADPTPTARIGGNDVPATLICEEDEVIGFDQNTPIPHPLACLHIDEL